jgi:uncharacterized protein with von Willebrand factor type A (vWA) domain
LEVAIYQKRSFYCIHFDHTTDIKHLHTNEFPKNKGKDIKEVLDLASYFSGGGTLFEPALTKARMLIDQEEAYSKADILFLTDGESVVTKEWLADYLKWKHDNKVSIYGVLIDVGYNSKSSMKLFCDSVSNLSSINESEREDLAINLFENV